MAYKQSQIDKSNFAWFKNDTTRQSLCGISLTKGTIRGLTPFSASFTYPITAFSGGNGSGKSSLLALAACAFHNEEGGFTPALRSKTYYTFQDFFVQSNGEVPIQGVEIKYQINHNNWRHGKPGIGTQVRKKAKGGRWNDYERRVNRNVIYFGVQRVVPHYERSTHKSYRSKFKPGTVSEEVRARIKEAASRIIGKSYEDFNTHVHSKYTLPVASVNGFSYSGFNMGAGEGSVFDILSTLFSAGEGSLLVIDEIELGLHELAQVRLIEELKKLCGEFKCQVICSTHSHAVIRSLPPEARFHVENISGKTFLTPDISADFACGKMGKPNAHEIDVFVEDQVAVEVLKACLPIHFRKRVKIKAIGSHSAVIRQLSSRNLEGIDSCLCVLDGDQSTVKEKKITQVIDTCEASNPAEKEKIHIWAANRIFFLPGDNWPEKWVIEQAKITVVDKADASAYELMRLWNIDEREELLSYLDEADAAEKHNEFFTLGASTELGEERVRSDLVTFVVRRRTQQFEKLLQAIEGALKACGI